MTENTANDQERKPEDEGQPQAAAASQAAGDTPPETPPEAKEGRSGHSLPCEQDAVCEQEELRDPDTYPVDALQFAAGSVAPFVAASTVEDSDPVGYAVHRIKVGTAEEQVHGAICYLQKIAELTPWTWDDWIVEILHKLDSCDVVVQLVTEWLTDGRIAPEPPATEADKRKQVEEAGLDWAQVLRFVPRIAAVIKLFR